MATLYIKYAKKCEKMFFFQIINVHIYGPFWPEGGYANAILYLVKKSINIMVGSWSGLIL